MTVGNSPAALMRTPVLVAAVAWCACDRRDAEIPETIESPPPVTVAIVDSATVANLTFMSQFTETGFVTLVDGQFIDDEQQIQVALDPHVAFGNLDEDEAEEAVAVLGTNTGGSGGFLDLAVVDDREGTAVNSATLYLGDRLRIHSVAIVEGEILLDVTMHAPGDPMCCPSLRKTRRFQVRRGALAEVEDE